MGCWGVHVRSSKCSLFADTNCGIVRCCASRIFAVPFLLLFLPPILLDDQNQQHGRKNLLTQVRSLGPFACFCAQVAFSFNISVPIHTLFRSCNVIASVLLGCAILLKSVECRCSRCLRIEIRCTSSRSDQVDMLMSSRKVFAFWSAVFLEAAGLCPVHYGLKLRNSFEMWWLCDVVSAVKCDACIIHRVIRVECREVGIFLGSAPGQQAPEIYQYARDVVGLSGAHYFTWLPLAFLFCSLVAWVWVRANGFCV